jgi:hypothetical protein
VTGEPIRWVGFVLGVAVIASTLSSLIGSVVVPRGVSSRITYVLWWSVRVPFMAIARRRPDFEQQDRMLALLGPVSLLTLLSGWLLLFLVGFALVLWPLIEGGFDAALRLSGSSLFTLGFASAPGGPATVVAFLAAATGLIVVALQIGYLPTIYAAFNRRETLMTLLNSRAGEPAWGPELLARQQFLGNLSTLPALFADWEQWAADVTETHANYPWLMSFRSPYRTRSWVISLLAVLDAAALYLAVAPERGPIQARQCLRMGYVGLRTLARAVGIRVDDDPLPSAPIALRFEEFAKAVDYIRAAGFPIERSAEESWPDFRGWRVNYEAAAYALADYLVAVPALWSGPRSTSDGTHLPPKRPLDRSPSEPTGKESWRRAPVPPPTSDRS